MTQAYRHIKMPVAGEKIHVDGDRLVVPEQPPEPACGSGMRQ